MRVADGPIAATVAHLSELPAAGIHALLGVGSFLENVIPPVPADSFIGAGGVLAATGAINPVLGFSIVWGMNVFGAIWVYRLGLRHGEKAFSSPVGRLVLDPRQLERLRTFYERRGPWAIFVARFLPGLRAVVPAFAGVTGLGAWRVVPPLVAASLIWYGAIFGVGYWAGENVEAVDGFLQSANRLLLPAALAVVLVVGWFWKRSRSSAGPPAGAGTPPVASRSGEADEKSPGQGPGA